MKLSLLKSLKGIVCLLINAHLPYVHVFYAFCFMHMCVLTCPQFLTLVYACCNTRCNMYVLCLHAFTNQCLLSFRTIGTPCDGRAILLAHSAWIAHGFHDHHMRKKLPPKGGKGGVAHWAHRLHTRCLLVKLPHLTFGSAAGKELNI